MTGENTLSVQDGRELLESNRHMAELLRGMAELIKTTNDRMAALEQQVRMLEKVTPQQAAELNGMIRARAAVVCADYRAKGMENAAASAIRKSVRVSTGTRCVRDVPRCDFRVVAEQIATWDEYKTMKALRAKAAKMEAAKA